MINQIISAAIDNGELLAKHAGGEAKKGETTSNGGLFKFLMNSVQGAEDKEEFPGKWANQQQTNNFIGGKLLSNPKNEQGDGHRLTDILAGLDNETRNELLTISELLKGLETESPEKETDNNELIVYDTSEKNSLIAVNEGSLFIESEAQTEKKAADSLLSHDKTGFDDSAEATERNSKAENEHILITDEKIENKVIENNEIADETVFNSNEAEDQTGSDTDEISGNKSSAKNADFLLNSEDETILDEKSVEAEPAALNTNELQGNQKFDNQIFTDEDGKKIKDKFSQSSGDVENKQNKNLHSEQQVQADQTTEKISSDANAKNDTKGKTQVGAVSETAATGATKLKSETNLKDLQIPVQNFSGGINDGIEKDLAADGKEVQTEGIGTNGEKIAVNETEQPNRERNKGIVNQLRAFAAAHSIVVQTPSIPTDDTLDTKTDDANLLQNIFKAMSNGNADQEAAEVRSLKANQLRELRSRNYQSSFANRLDYTFSEASSTSGSGSAAPVSGMDLLNVISSSGIVPTSVSFSMDQMNEDGAILWKEHIAEYFESNEKNSENQAAFARLSQVPVTNITVRKNFAMSLGQAIMSATGDGKKAAESWQKHSFVLENGKNIQLSARQVDGVLQLKLSSSHSELNKLLINHQDEIREHLEKEIDVTIDLQLDGQGADQASDFLNGSGNKGQSGKQSYDQGTAKVSEQSVEEVVPKAVRKFGYNQMEWTA